MIENFFHLLKALAMLIERLIKQSGVSRSQLERIATTASLRYFNFEVDKKTTGKRLISHPSRELKSIQRWLNKALLSKLPVHPSATAYRKGSSIKTNAELHRLSNFTVRFDFRNYFPSFTHEGIKLFLLMKNDIFNLGLDTEDIAFIVAIVTRYGALTIGAPTSPFLTNAMMYDFDEHMAKFCESSHLVYSRYADDIFISTNEPGGLEAVSCVLHEFVESIPWVKLEVNADKTAFLSRKYRRTITGLTITSDRKVSVGRKNKKRIKSMIYRFSQKCLTPQEAGQLSGLIGFVYSVERDFYDNLCKKYGSEVVDDIVRIRPVSLKVQKTTELQ
jgi:RNA-directed DNA polymerase